MIPPTPPKGSLEDLFRHHLLESEVAAVTPRPYVWEQLDNTLLLAQNERYRRRLQVHRWAVAASLLLAALAGGGWWHSQQQVATPLAHATRTGSKILVLAGHVSAQPTHNTIAVPSLATDLRKAASSAQVAAVNALSSSINEFSIARSTTSYSTSHSANHSSRVANMQQRDRLAMNAFSSAGQAESMRQQMLRYQKVDEIASVLATRPEGPTTNTPGVTGALTSALKPSSIAAVSSLDRRRLLHSTSEITTWATTTDNTNPVTAATSNYDKGDTLADANDIPFLINRIDQPVAASTLSTRPIELAITTSTLPNSLRELPLPESPKPALARRWQFGLDYATTAFQPNIDFSKDISSYSKTLGVSSAALTRAAAVEYRNHLQAGLGQRLSLWAMRRLGNGRFGLRTGLELAQNTASSATTVAFVGEQVPDISYIQITPALRPTSYRYRSASTPVELHYSNPVKIGFSFYSRLGGLFTTLLNVRSEVAGTPEATRTYAFTSTDSPYRHISAAMRGGAGVCYRPAHHQWALSLGPLFETGILSLNEKPTQDFWSQKRPYSFGLEAGVELGRAPRIR